MDTTEALAIVEDYRKRRGLRGTLETLIAMKADPFLSHRERAGYAVAMLGFDRLFNGPEEA